MIVTASAALVALPASVLVTVTARAPTGAVLAAVSVTRRWVASILVTGPTVTPVPEIVTATPVLNAVPTMSTATAWPRATVPGVTDVMVGPGLTVKQPVHVALAPPGTVTVTFPAPS